MKPLPPYPRLYEINTRVWLRRFDTPGRRATLDQVPAEFWDGLAGAGFDLVWLMGVWRTNPRAVPKHCLRPDLVEGYRRALPDWREEDVIGSPYAVDDYVLSPALDEAEGLIRLRRTLHRRGMRLVLDFVSNHFSAESCLIPGHPQVFLQGTEALLQREPEVFYRPESLERVLAHGRDPYFPPWTDTAQVNYFDREARRFMTDRLLRLTQVCDGVRCDMAMLALNEVFQWTWGGVLNEMKLQKPEEEFWPQAISAVKARFPGFILMAEAYWGKEKVLQEMGFDYTYDKALTDRLREGNAEAVRRHLTADPALQRKSVHFLENHDEERAVTALGEARSLAGAVIIGTIPGMRLFHDGQLEGRRIRLPVQLGREPHEAVREDIRAFYHRLLAATRDPVFAAGDWQMLPVGPGEPAHGPAVPLLAWLWRAGEQRRLVIVHFSGGSFQGLVRFDAGDSQGRVELTDLLTQQVYAAERRQVQEEGLAVRLEAYQCRIYSFSDEKSP